MSKFCSHQWSGKGEYCNLAIKLALVDPKYLRQVELWETTFSFFKLYCERVQPKGFWQILGATHGLIYLCGGEQRCELCPGRALKNVAEITTNFEISRK